MGSDRHNLPELQEGIVDSPHRHRRHTGDLVGRRFGMEVVVRDMGGIVDRHRDRSGIAVEADAGAKTRRHWVGEAVGKDEKSRYRPVLKVVESAGEGASRKAAVQRVVVVSTLPPGMDSRFALSPVQDRLVGDNQGCNTVRGTVGECSD